MRRSFRLWLLVAIAVATALHGGGAAFDVLPDDVNADIARLAHLVVLGCTAALGANDWRNGKDMDAAIVPRRAGSKHPSP